MPKARPSRLAIRLLEIVVMGSMGNGADREIHGLPERVVAKLGDRRRNNARGHSLERLADQIGEFHQKALLFEVCSSITDKTLLRMAEVGRCHA
jgi:hypothetical protein